MDNRLLHGMYIIERKKNAQLDNLQKHSQIDVSAINLKSLALFML
jgi:hypothetical protein